MELSPEKVYAHPRQKLARLRHLLRAATRRPHKQLIAALLPVLPDDGIVLDVGAHFGYITKEFARLHNGTLQIIAFEPVSYCHAILGRITRSYQNVIIEKSALSDSTGMIDIAIPVKESGSLGIGLSHMGAETERDYIIESVPVQTLDDYRAQKILPHWPDKRVAFIKMDIEGAEWLVLQGARQTLKQDSPVLFLEINHAYCQRLGYRPADIFTYLDALGYRAHLVQKRQKPARPAYAITEIDGYQGIGDYLFIPTKTGRDESIDII